VLADIRQRLLYDAHQFSTDTRRQGNILRFRDKTSGNAQLASKPIHRPHHALQKAGGLNFQRLYSLHFLSQIRNLVVDKFLQVPHSLDGAPMLTRGDLCPPQNINLHFQPYQRLNNAVVKILREARPLPGLGA
jgi:hypothetical protein